MKNQFSFIQHNYIIMSGLMTCALLLIGIQAGAQQISQHKMKEKILFVLTSHDQIGETGKKTGFYLSEAAHPWKVLSEAGYEVDFVSPQGGKAPVDGLKLDDPVNKKFWEDPKIQDKITHTLKPSEVNPMDYVAIHFAGGHGTMWDFPQDEELAEIARIIYENNGILSAVCHGPSALVNLKLSDGSYLVKGKKVNSFTNEEEKAVNYDQVVPFLLEAKLIERGAIFEKSPNFQPHVVADQRLVTGQNPASAHLLAEKVLELLTHAK